MELLGEKLFWLLSSLQFFAKIFPQKFHRILEFQNLLFYVALKSKVPALAFRTPRGLLA